MSKAKPSKKKAPAAKKRPAAAPRKRKPAAPAASSQPSAAAAVADVTTRPVNEGDKVAYRNARGSLQDGTIEKVVDGEATVIALGDGRSRKNLKRAAGADPQPGEWQLV